MPVIAVSVASHLPAEDLVPELAAQLGYALAGP